jgi:hypothetical protein
MEKIVGIYTDISQFIIGLLVEETDDKIVLNRALYTTVEKDPANPGVIPRFYPVTLLTIDPPFHVMGFLKDFQNTIDFPTTFWKNRCLSGVLELTDQMKDVYNRNFAGLIPNVDAPAPANPSAPENNIVKMY